MDHAVPLTPPKSLLPFRLLSCERSAPARPGERSVSSLPATLIRRLACVANKALTKALNPLNATLTKNTGRGTPRFPSAFPHLPSSVHTSKFRIPQLLCLPLLRKQPGCGGILPILVCPKHIREVHPEDSRWVRCADLFCASSVPYASSVSSMLNPSLPLNFQLSTVNLFLRPPHIGFPPPHPLKSPHRPLPGHHEATS
jgi:hypothetical protein